jgi:uncharacterized coiled-coil protein SlyX
MTAWAGMNIPDSEKIAALQRKVAEQQKLIERILDRLDRVERLAQDIEGKVL